MPSNRDADASTDLSFKRLPHDGSFKDSQDLNPPFHPSRPILNFFEQTESMSKAYIRRCKEAGFKELGLPIVWSHHELSNNEFDFSSESRDWVQWAKTAFKSGLKPTLLILCGPAPIYEDAGVPSSYHQASSLHSDGDAQLFYSDSKVCHLPSILSENLIRGFDRFLKAFFDNFQEHGFRPYEIRCELLVPTFKRSALEQEDQKDIFGMGVFDFSKKSESSFKTFLENESYYTSLCDQIWASDREELHLNAFRVGHLLPDWGESLVLKFAYSLGQVLAERAQLIGSHFLGEKVTFEKKSYAWSNADAESLLLVSLGFRTAFEREFESIREWSKRGINLISKPSRSPHQDFLQLAKVAFDLESFQDSGSGAPGSDSAAYEFSQFLKKYGNHRGRVWRACFLCREDFREQKRLAEPFLKPFEKSLPEGIAFCHSMDDSRIENSELIVFGKSYFPDQGEINSIRRLLQDGKTIVLLEGHYKIMEDDLSDFVHKTESRVMEFDFGLPYSSIEVGDLSGGTLVTVSESPSEGGDDFTAYQLFASSVVGYSCERNLIRLSEEGLDLVLHDMGSSAKSSRTNQNFGRHFCAVIMNPSSGFVESDFILGRAVMALGHVASSGTDAKIYDQQGSLKVPPRGFIALELGVYDD